MQGCGSLDDVALRKFIPNRTSGVREFMTLNIYFPELDISVSLTYLSITFQVNSFWEQNTL
jgi:hypothetical protein